MQPEPKVIIPGRKRSPFLSPNRIFFFFCLMIIFLLQGCATRSHYQTDPKWIGYSENGEASYYAMKFLFRSTASGERFNNFAFTAAHKTLPFGAKVLVTNIKNGHQVVVRINDRGPFIKGRIIDLTRTAFSKIADIGKGVANVEIRVIE